MAPTRSAGYDVVRVGGPPERRGRAYGLAVRDRVRAAIAGYAVVFEHYAGWDWSQVRRHALKFSSTVDDFSPSSARELRAIADGAGVEYADILALNTRSEIMFAAPGPARAVAATECTSFALGPSRSADGHVVLAQNWDWIELARRTAVVLVVSRDDGPGFVTVVEAGMLAKVGVNASGVGLCTNTLISDGAEGSIAVPYHVLLRSVLDSDSGTEAVERIESTPRANSANYLVADDTGFCVDLETTPGSGPCARIRQRDGLVSHANHFLTPGLTTVDRYLERKSNTRNRMANLTRLVDRPGRWTESELRSVLADHADAPSSVCQHPDPDQHEAERTCTIAGVMIDVQGRSLSYTSGSPCESAWAGPVFAGERVSP